MDEILTRKPGRKRLEVTPELIAQVKAAHRDQENVPIRVLAKSLKMSPKRFYKILKMETP